MDQPYCEICGEEYASLQIEEAAVCDDCFADENRKALTPVMGKRCCFPVWQRNGELSICVAEYGVEHVH